LDSIGIISIVRNYGLMSINFSGLKALTNINEETVITDCPSLTTIGFNLLEKLSNPKIDFRNNKLSSTTIDYLLNKFVTITPAITGKNIKLNEQNPIAPPTEQGLLDKQTLIDGGNIVITDENE
jgi:hypothetical protein